MKKTYLGLAAAALGAMLAFPIGAQAAPAAAPAGVFNAGFAVTDVRYRRPTVRRTIRRTIRRAAPRCRVVVTRRVNQRGVLVTKRVRRCR